MKKNIVFLLKYRIIILKNILKTNQFEFISPKILPTNLYLNIKDYFDNESIAVFLTLKKRINDKDIFIIETIDKYGINVAVRKYTDEDEVKRVIEFNYNRSDYINKQIMSIVIFSLKFDDVYFIFSYIHPLKLIKYDSSIEIQQNLIDHYYKDFKTNKLTVDVNKVFFINDVVKYIKIHNEFKTTQYSPYYINL